MQPSRVRRTAVPYWVTRGRTRLASNRFQATITPLHPSIPLVGAIPERHVDKFQASRNVNWERHHHDDLGPPHLPICNTTAPSCIRDPDTATPQVGTHTIPFFRSKANDDRSMVPQFGTFCTFSLSRTYNPITR